MKIDKVVTHVDLYFQGATSGTAIQGPPGPQGPPGIQGITGTLINFHIRKQQQCSVKHLNSLCLLCQCRKSCFEKHSIITLLPF